MPKSNNHHNPQGVTAPQLAPIIERVLTSHGVTRQVAREMMRAAANAARDDRWPFVQITPAALIDLPREMRAADRPATVLRVWVHLLGQLRAEGVCADATPAQLHQSLGVGRSHACEALAWLEARKAIKRRHDGVRMRVYINPRLAWRGREIDRQNALALLPT